MPRQLRKRILESPVKCDKREKTTMKTKDIPQGSSRGRKHESLKSTEEQPRLTRAKSKAQLIPQDGSPQSSKLEAPESNVIQLRSNKTKLKVQLFPLEENPQCSQLATPESNDIQPRSTKTKLGTQQNEDNDAKSWRKKNALVEFAKALAPAKREFLSWENLGFVDAQATASLIDSDEVKTHKLCVHPNFAEYLMDDPRNETLYEMVYK